MTQRINEAHSQQSATRRSARIAAQKSWNPSRRRVPHCVSRQVHHNLHIKFRY